jgi:hypothetical protein
MHRVSTHVQQGAHLITDSLLKITSYEFALVSG